MFAPDVARDNIPSPRQQLSSCVEKGVYSIQLHADPPPGTTMDGDRSKIGQIFASIDKDGLTAEHTQALVLALDTLAPPEMSSDAFLSLCDVLAPEAPFLLHTVAAPASTSACVIEALTHVARLLLLPVHQPVDSIPVSGLERRAKSRRVESEERTRRSTDAQGELANTRRRLEDVLIPRLLMRGVSTSDLTKVLLHATASRVPLPLTAPRRELLSNIDEDFGLQCVSCLEKRSSDAHDTTNFPFLIRLGSGEYSLGGGSCSSSTLHGSLPEHSLSMLSSSSPRTSCSPLLESRLSSSSIGSGTTTASSSSGGAASFFVTRRPAKATRTVSTWVPRAPKCQLDDNRSFTSVRHRLASPSASLQRRIDTKDAKFSRHVPALSFNPPPALPSPRLKCKTSTSQSAPHTPERQKIRCFHRDEPLTVS